MLREVKKIVQHVVMIKDFSLAAEIFNHWGKIV